ncbi:MFS transporter, partial [SAR202 cluster bacterium AD-802-E10_MRT_200m]|nr:MFS transporter [SAR202 cluster bacterium AD-802-E10_MRT_200m]
MKYGNKRSASIIDRRVQGIKNKLPSVFYGWWIMTAGVIINAVGTGVYNSSSTIFFLPITYSLKISRSATTLIFAIARIQVAVTGPLIGYLLDRWGPRPMVFIGALIMGIGYILLYGAENYTYLIVVFAGIITLGNNLAFTHSVMTTVNNWFVRRRALALAIAGTAFGIGGTLMAPILGYSVHIWGWRTTAIVAGILVMAFAMPTSYFLRRSPESMGLLPDGFEAEKERSNPNTIARSEPIDGSSYSIAQWLGSPVFWVIMFSITLRMAVNWTITLHFVPIMVWKGIKEHEAAVLFGVVGFLNIPARLLLGVAGDRYSKPLLLVTCLALGTASLFYLLYLGSNGFIWG